MTTYPGRNRSDEITLRDRQVATTCPDRVNGRASINSNLEKDYHNVSIASL